MKNYLFLLLLLAAFTSFGKSMVGTNEVAELKAFVQDQFSTNTVSGNKQVRIRASAIDNTNIITGTINSNKFDAFTLALFGDSITGQTVSNLWKQAIYVGDSNTAPTNDGRINYYRTTDPVWTALGISTTNLATGGNTISNMIVDYPTQARPFRSKTINDVSYALTWAGINDILVSGRTASQITNDLVTYWSLLRADRFRVVAFALAPTTNTDPPEEAIRLAVNTFITNATTLYDFIIRPDLLFPNPADTTYYSDGLHLTTLASAMLGSNILSIVTAPTNFYTGLAAGVIPASNSVFHSILQVSGNLGLNEDVPGGSATLRFGETPGGTLNIASGSSNLMSLNINSNVINAPLIVTATNGVDSSTTDRALDVYGNIHTRKFMSLSNALGGVILMQRPADAVGNSLGTIHAYNGLTRVGIAGFYSSTAVNDGEFRVSLSTAGGTPLQWFTIKTNGHILIGTTSDSGGTDMLQVSGGGTFSGSLKLSGSTSASVIARNRTSGTGNIYDTFALSGSIKAYMGIAGDVGGLVTGSVAGDLVLRGETQSILFTTDGAASIALRLSTSGNVSTPYGFSAGTTNAAGNGNILATNGVTARNFTNTINSTYGADWDGKFDLPNKNDIWDAGFSTAANGTNFSDIVVTNTIRLEGGGPFADTLITNKSGTSLRIHGDSSTIIKTGTNQLVLSSTQGVTVGGMGFRVDSGGLAVGTTQNVGTSNGIVTGNFQVDRQMTANHFSGITNIPPTIASGAGAGTSPTITITGSDAAGVISITSGTLPSVSAAIATITFGTVKSGVTSVVCWPHNAAASTLGFLPYSVGSASSWTLNAGTLGLTAATTYEYQYIVMGTGQ